MNFLGNLNREQIQAYLLGLFATTGPLAGVIGRLFGLDNQRVTDVLTLATLATPIISGVIYGLLQSNKKKIESVSRMSPEDQQQALQKVPDDVKVKIAEAVPGVATVVVDNSATGKLADLAQSPEHPNIVTAAKNEADATQGFAPKETP